MPDPKDGESFFRRVVKFVANPATDWAEVASRQDDARDTELEKSELKAMIERKRRNDFVRKREFDMLRRLRREGLSPEQLAALGGSSRIDDPDARISESGLRQDGRVKAKIDEIEKQMVGDASRAAARRTTGFGSAPTEPLAFQPDPLGRRSVLPESQRTGEASDAYDDEPLPALPPLPDFEVTPAAAAPTSATMGTGLAPLKPGGAPLSSAAKAPVAAFAPTGVDAIEVSEVVHDPELDEAVIAFANADFGHCEQSLTQLLAPAAERADHAETWLVLFDLYRAIGQQSKFESLALDYVNRFGSSSPQWFSLPRLVAEAVASEDRASPAPSHATDIGWIAPEHLDLDAVARLRSVTLQLPLPWVLDWAAVRRIDAEAASQLTVVMRQWAGQKVEMRWLAGDQLLGALNDAAPTGVRDADPAFWMARLEALRLANRPDQFDEAAIDYCVTYEVSPPSWERADCIARISGSSSASTTPQASVVTEVTTSYFESSLQDDSQQGLQIANVELSGQLVGDISQTLGRLDQQVHTANLVTVSCARLIRVDFIAAGDLLNWVLAKRNQERSVTFSEAHRLVALFFGAMGINEHARVQVRRN